MTLALLTAETGDEFAIFAKGRIKIIARGTSGNWQLPDDLLKEIFYNQHNLSGHSHPTTVNLKVSNEDRNTIKRFSRQKKSSIIDLKGNTTKFSWNKFDDEGKGL